MVSTPSATTAAMRTAPDLMAVTRLLGDGCVRNALTAARKTDHCAFCLILSANADRYFTVPSGLIHDA